MSTHILQGRTEDEVLWFRRRSVLQGALAWTGMGGFAAAQAQQRSNIVAMQGDALLNGVPLRREQVIQTGDHLETGPGSDLSFVVGNAAFHVRENSRITVERGQTLNTVSLLRMLTGAVISAWGRGTSRSIVTPTLTAGIRGTGVYTEIFPQQAWRSYFCNCYGTVDLTVGDDHVVSQSVYHQSFWSEAQAKGGHLLSAARAINHTDEEVEFLAALIGERTAWEIAGRKGNHDGSGYMDPGHAHPLAR
jgi:hypothetical protein